MPAAATPLTAAYARLAEVYPYLKVTLLNAPAEELPDGEGWVTGDGLAAGGEQLDSFLAWDDEQVLRDYGQRGRPDVIASFGLHRYAWPLCLMITLPWFLHRRVPRLPAAHVAYHRTTSHMTLRPGAFACLPDDPAADEPGAVVVADEEALRAEVRAAVAEHLEPVLGAFGPRMRRRGRALWGMATDEIVEGLWYVAGLLGEGEESRAMRELERLLPGATKPYAGSAAFRELTAADGAPVTTRDRVSCCMFYTLRPAEACDTCPRTCDSERVARLTATTAAA
ncbi:(2Fe-2S)-binding protein [Streptomyces sp. NPDC004549]|uniref:(2Fe-2S)-binding protein n=1 Tax=Streptomyces sp. NPDC004549 TaxID=3154283 RepID=UPI00339E632D